jgi:ribonuclease HI
MEDSKDVDNGIVLYTDGGCRPTNPGPGGYGIHGYMYSTAAPKKGPGLSGMMLTVHGYAVKEKAVAETEGDEEENPEAEVMRVEMAAEIAAAEAEEEDGEDDAKKVPVTPLHYFDGFGALGPGVSNNYAELMATTRGLQAAAQHAIKEVRIFTDSEYVCKGLEKWAPQWQANGWKKHDGSEPANVETWKELVASRNFLTERGVEVKINWIKGHADHLGNEKADTLATLGVMHNRKEGTTEVMERTTADGYWSWSVDKHPFINLRRLYFNTVEGYNHRGHYYIGDHGKDDELLGKRISDGCYAVLRLKEPDLVIEMLRNYQTKLAGDMNNLVMIRLDQMYRPDTHKQLTNYGEYAIEQVNPRRGDMFCLDREPLTREFQPPRLAHRAIESLSSMEEKLDWYLNKDPRLVTTDLTGILYEAATKKSKKGEEEATLKLKAEYIVGYAALRVDANYQSPDGVKAVPITLTLGIDMLDRNSLKRLEDLNPKVTLVSWLDSPTVFRYATIVEADSSVGIWAGVYSNIRVVS